MKSLSIARALPRAWRKGKPGSQKIKLPRRQQDECLSINSKSRA
jgi:hypothetical protein